MRSLLALCLLYGVALPLAAQSDSVLIVSAKALSKAPKPRNRPDINYRPGVPATVRLVFVIDTAGAVEPSSIQILAATDSGFAAAARNMIRQVHFTPSTYDGAPVRVRIEQKVTFKADQAPTPY